MQGSGAGEKAGAAPDALSRPVLAAFSATNFGKSTFWTLADILCLVFATDTLGLEPAFAGAIILATLVWDAVSDPIVGALVERSPVLSRTYGRVILWAAPAAALLLPMIFAAQFIEGAGGVAVFLIFLLLFRTAFTFVDIPDNALFARVSLTDQLRIEGAAARKLMATIAAVGVSASTAWVFSDAAPFSEGGRILIAAMAAGPVAAAALALGARAVARWDRAPAQAQALRLSLVALTRCPAVTAVAAHIFLSTFAMAVFTGAIVYYARFILGDAAWFADAMTTYLLAQAGGVVLWGWIAARTSIRPGLRAAALACVAAGPAYLVYDAPYVFLVACGFFGLCAGGLNTLRWAMAASVVDEAAPQLGRRSEAAIMALFSLSVKTAIGVASLAVGAVLSLSGYAPGDVASPEGAVLFQYCVFAMFAAAMLASTLPLTVRRA